MGNLGLQLLMLLFDTVKIFACFNVVKVFALQVVAFCFQLREVSLRLDPDLFLFCCAVLGLSYRRS